MTELRKPLIEFWDNEEDRYGKEYDKKNRISLEDMLPHATPLQIRMIEYELLMNKDKIIEMILKEEEK